MGDNIPLPPSLPPLLEPSEKLFDRAVHRILEDDGFKVPSDLATSARSLASRLVTYHEKNSALVKAFSEQFVSRLKTCFSTKKSFKLAKEAMWKAYHALRTSDSFNDEWIKFIEDALGEKPTPIFYQHVTHEVFKILIKTNYSVPDASSTCIAPPMTREEQNALRFVSGYIIRKVKDKLEASSSLSKNDMLMCLVDMGGDEMDDGGTEDWVNAIDRGGLWHVNDQTYNVFVAIEEVVRTYLHPAAATKVNDSKKIIIDSILGDEDVQFQWCMITTALEEAVSQELLLEISTLFVTVRGFAFASSCVETYKKLSKKTLQKGKGIRKQLFTPNI